MTVPADTELAPSRRTGRPMDASRDEAIRIAVFELLAEVGYDRLTIDAVAARAHVGKATVYRRWTSKAELVVDLVRCQQLHVDAPDTGSVRGDLEAIIASDMGPSDEQTRCTAGLASALSRNPELLEAFRDTVMAAGCELFETIFARGIERGEIAANRDISLLARIVPALMFQQGVLLGTPPDRAFLHRAIGEVLIPLAIS